MHNSSLKQVGNFCPLFFVLYSRHFVNSHLATRLLSLFLFLIHSHPLNVKWSMNQDQWISLVNHLKLFTIDSSMSKVSLILLYIVPHPRTLSPMCVSCMTLSYSTWLLSQLISNVLLAKSSLSLSLSPFNSPLELVDRWLQSLRPPRLQGHVRPGHESGDFYRICPCSVLFNFWYSGRQTLLDI